MLAMVTITDPYQNAWHAINAYYMKDSFVIQKYKF